jgi:hypothetical protein
MVRGSTAPVSSRRASISAKDDHWAKLAGPSAKTLGQDALVLEKGGQTHVRLGCPGDYPRVASRNCAISVEKSPRHGKREGNHVFYPKGRNAWPLRAIRFRRQMHPSQAREWVFPADSASGHLAETKEDRDELWGNDLRQTFRTIATAKDTFSRARRQAMA